MLAQVTRVLEAITQLDPFLKFITTVDAYSKSKLFRIFTTIISEENYIFRPVRCELFAVLVQITASMSPLVLGAYPTVFQSEVHVIEICARENLFRKLTGERNYILSDSRAALNALSPCTFESKLVWN